MEHKVTKIRRFLEHEMHRRHENNKNQRKTLFCKASVLLARLCQKHSICILQVNLRLPMNSFQQPFGPVFTEKKKQ